MQVARRTKQQRSICGASSGFCDDLSGDHLRLR
ncbi:unnamed protein product [Cylicostephanus goldi]|uniref:Uncharacterized protein n=1 Tax=Cylicostephanus goldi TaxID=71465 RepID=A0A3P7MXJ5_CYLGO|nr:unnamed protein product [Cylicostephanus goldi]